jgi:type I restriction-modification system DNA methylase subunit
MLPDEEERYRVNAFDWGSAFPQVFAQGGFDAMIGNPPYIRIQTLQETSSIDVDFFKKKYRSASKGNYDIYVIFVEKGLALLNEKGRLGFILPHKFFNSMYGESLRGMIAEGKYLAKLIHFGDQQVFANATTYTCLMFLDKAEHDEFEVEKVKELEGWLTHNHSSEDPRSEETLNVSTTGNFNSNCSGIASLI